MKHLIYLGNLTARLPNVSAAQSAAESLNTINGNGSTDITRFRMLNDPRACSLIRLVIAANGIRQATSHPGHSLPVSTVHQRWQYS